jgi:hypothetical protein
MVISDSQEVGNDSSSSSSPSSLSQTSTSIVYIYISMTYAQDIHASWLAGARAIHRTGAHQWLIGQKGDTCRMAHHGHQNFKII